MAIIPANKRVKIGLRRTLWELLTPNATSYSTVISKFAYLDTAALSKIGQEYHKALIDVAIVSCTYAWHQTMNGRAVYRATLPSRMNRAERYLARALLEFGHAVAKNTIDRLEDGYQAPAEFQEPRPGSS